MKTVYIYGLILVIASSILFYNAGVKSKAGEKKRVDSALVVMTSKCNRLQDSVSLLHTRLSYRHIDYDSVASTFLLSLGGLQSIYEDEGKTCDDYKREEAKLNELIRIYPYMVRINEKNGVKYYSMKYPSGLVMYYYVDKVPPR